VACADDISSVCRDLRVIEDDDHGKKTLNSQGGS